MPVLGMTEGFDVGLEMSGAAPAFRDMIDTMNNGGKIAILGIAPTGFEIDWNKVIFKMLHLKGIYGREMFETWYKMIALVQGPLDVSGLITHRIGIDDFQTGFDAMRSGSSGKVVMDLVRARSQETERVAEADDSPDLWGRCPAGQRGALPLASFPSEPDAPPAPPRR